MFKRNRSEMQRGGTFAAFRISSSGDLCGLLHQGEILIESPQNTSNGQKKKTMRHFISALQTFCVASSDLIYKAVDLHRARYPLRVVSAPRRAAASQ